MDRRTFLNAVAVIAASAALPACRKAKAAASWVPAGYRYVGPYYDCGAFAMFLYISTDELSYGFLTLHRHDEGQCYRGPFPGAEWDASDNDQQWLRTYYPEAFSS